jgi:hypothetical protein
MPVFTDSTSGSKVQLAARGVKQRLHLRIKGVLNLFWVEEAKALFDGDTIFDVVFRLDRIPFERQRNVIDIECEIAGAPGDRRYLLRYPFERGLLVTVDHMKWPTFIPRGYSPFLIRVFQDARRKNLRELLNTVENLSEHLTARHVKEIRVQLGNQLSSTKNVRINNSAVVGAIAQAVALIETNSKEESFIESFLTHIVGHRGYAELRSFPNSVFWGLLRRSVESEPFDTILLAEELLCLPFHLLYNQFMSDAVEEISQALLEVISAQGTKTRGHFFEALCLVDKLLVRKEKFLFLINGMIVTDPLRLKKEKDTNEFDIIELFKNDDDRAECHIYACTIGKGAAQKNREQIGKLADTVHSAFPDAIIRTWFAEPANKRRKDWTPSYAQAGIAYH